MYDLYVCESLENVEVSKDAYEKPDEMKRCLWVMRESYQPLMKATDHSSGRIKKCGQPSEMSIYVNSIASSEKNGSFTPSKTES